MTNKSESVYPVDRNLAQQHLDYLGYKPGESVYLRFFYHALDSRKNNDSGRKASELNWNAIENYQQEGRGVYVVVNGQGGGHSDSEIKECCAIFCEWDDLPIAEQSQKWQELGFVEPTFTVYSGDKSMQPYWVFSEPIAVEQWRELQELLIAVMRADKSNKNPSRVFRLAGGWHVKPGREPVKSTIAQDSGIRYSYGEICDRLLSLQPKLSLQPSLLLNAAPLQQPPPLAIQEQPRRYKDVTVPVPMVVSLTCALGKPKEFLHGVATLRNTSMTALARDLIGTANEFARLGQTTNDDAYTLFIDACRRCSPGDGWNEREWEQIWKSAVRSNPSASKNHAAPDAVENSIRGEYWRSISNQSSSTFLGNTGGDFAQLTQDEADSKLLRDYRRLSAVFGNRIRLNTLTKRIEIDDNPITLDRAKLQLAIKHNVVLKSGREDVQDMMAELAENNQYSPVAQYLLSLPKPSDTSILDSLAPRYLGVCEPIYSSMVRKTLIAAAARVLEPGCKVDTALILQSPQGWKKSQFFQKLAGDWFDDSFGAMSDKDERLKLHSAWILEWAELETVFKRKDVAATKAFLSCGSDSIRPPYGRETIKMLRPSIIVGTTNETEFLSDTTGNRRFWVVPIKKRIDTQLLEQERDAIWAAAVLAYHSGEHWWLDSDEERTASALVEEFQSLDPWHDHIADFVEHKEWVTVTSVLNHLQVDLNRQERAHQMRVAGVLKLLGWSKALRTVNGKRTRVWVRPLPPPSALNTVNAPSPIHPNFQPNDLPPEPQVQPKNELDRKVDRSKSVAVSSVCSVDTTCNSFFTKKKQKQGESEATEKISVKDGESSGSSSSRSSNLDISGFETMPPISSGRSNLDTSRSRGGTVQEIPPESKVSIDDIDRSQALARWVVQLSQKAQQQGVRYEAVKELGVPESMRQQVFSALSPQVKERLTELRKEFEGRIPEDTQRWIGVIETWSALVGEGALNAQWQQFDLWSQCLSGIGDWVHSLKASGLFDRAASRYAEAIEGTVAAETEPLGVETNTEAPIAPKQLDLLPDFIQPKSKADTDNRFSPDNENWL